MKLLSAKPRSTGVSGVDIAGAFKEHKVGIYPLPVTIGLQRDFCSVLLAFSIKIQSSPCLNLFFCLIHKSYISIAQDGVDSTINRHR